MSSGRLSGSSTMGATIVTPTSVAAWIRCGSNRLSETGIATIAIRSGTPTSDIGDLITVATCKPEARPGGAQEPPTSSTTWSAAIKMDAAGIASSRMLPGGSSITSPAGSRHLHQFVKSRGFRCRRDPSRSLFDRRSGFPSDRSCPYDSRPFLQIRRSANVGIGSSQRKCHTREGILIWEREGRPEGRAHDYWLAACVEEQECQDELMNDEEKVLAGRSDANFPALLTKDMQGG